MILSTAPTSTRARRRKEAIVDFWILRLVLLKEVVGVTCLSFFSKIGE